VGVTRIWIRKTVIEPVSIQAVIATIVLTIIAIAW
jgi:hypothetical protein